MTGHRIYNHVWLRPHCEIKVDRSIRFKRVDTNRCQVPAIAAGCYEWCQHLASLTTPLRWGEVFKIDDQSVRAAAKHGLMGRTVSARPKEPSAAQIRIEERHLMIRPRSQGRVRVMFLSV